MAAATDVTGAVATVADPTTIVDVADNNDDEDGDVVDAGPLILPLIKPEWLNISWEDGMHTKLLAGLPKAASIFDVFQIFNRNNLL